MVSTIDRLMESDIHVSQGGMQISIGDNIFGFGAVSNLVLYHGLINYKFHQFFLIKTSIRSYQPQNMVVASFWRASLFQVPGGTYFHLEP